MSHRRQPTGIHPTHKTAYRVKNWPEYEKALRNRGDIAVRFSQEATEAWTPKTERQ